MLLNVGHRKSQQIQQKLQKFRELDIRKLEYSFSIYLSIMHFILILFRFHYEFFLPSLRIVLLSLRKIFAFNLVAQILITNTGKLSVGAEKSQTWAFVSKRTRRRTKKRCLYDIVFKVSIKYKFNKELIYLLLCFK